MSVSGRTRIELTLVRPFQTPSSVLTDLSKQCEVYGIKTQDVYGDFSQSSSDSWLRGFERDAASYMGMEDAIFLPSGVMAQNIVLATSASTATPDQEKNFICHYTSHLLLHEKDAYQHLLNFHPLIVPCDPSKVVQVAMTYAQVAPMLDQVPAPKVLICEVPHRELGGKCTSFEDLEAMSAHCRKVGTKFHMDGARLWEASAFYIEQGHSVEDLCALFDSVYVSYYKGIGAITGAMLLGTNDFIKESRDWSRRFGGNLYSQLPYAVSCLAGFHENKDSFVRRRAAMREVVKAVTSMQAEWMLSSGGGGGGGTGITEPGEGEGEGEGTSTIAKYTNEKEKEWMVRFDPPEAQVSMIHVYINANKNDAIAANEAAVQRTGISCFMPGRVRETSSAIQGATGGGGCYFEFNIGPLNLDLDIESTWKAGYRAFLEELKRIRIKR